MITPITSLSGVSVKTSTSTPKSDAGDALNQAVIRTPKVLSTVAGAPEQPSPSADVKGKEEQERSASATATGKELKQAVESINGFLQDNKRALEFSVDDETGEVVITVMDIDRKEVIRQIPSELALKLMEQAREAGGMKWTGLNERA